MLAAVVPLGIQLGTFLVIGSVPHGVGILGLVEHAVRIVFAVARRGEVFGGDLAEIEVDRGEQLLDVIGRRERGAVKGDLEVEPTVFVARFDVQRGRRFRGGLRIALRRRVFFQQFRQLDAQPGFFLVQPRGAGGGDRLRAQAALVAPLRAVCFLVGRAEQGQAVFERGLIGGERRLETMPAGRQRRVELRAQAQHLAMQAGQLMRDACGESQRFQRVQPGEGAVRVGVLRSDARKVGTQGAIAGLRP